MVDLMVLTRISQGYYFARKEAEFYRRALEEDDLQRMYHNPTLRRRAEEFIVELLDIGRGVGYSLYYLLHPTNAIDMTYALSLIGKAQKERIKELERRLKNKDLF